MYVDFEVAPLGPKFQRSESTLALKILNHINVYSKNLDQDLSFEWIKIFAGHLNVDLLEL